MAMEQDGRIETKFLVPLCEDAEMGSGRKHPATRWKWLQDELIVRFGGYTKSRTIKDGVWMDPDTGENISDESREYYLDIAVDQLSCMERLLEEVGRRFRQKCIRFVSQGEVRYITSSRTQ